MKTLAIFLIFLYLFASGLDSFAYILLFLYLSYLAASSQSPTAIGSRGEKRVRKKIESFVKAHDEYVSFHNLTLETPDGTTQIDHVLISPYGIFVIETKNYKGWIFGGSEQKRWTQTIYHHKYKFQNPLRQNFKHIKAVQNYLGVNMKDMFSIVVFAGNSRFKTTMPDNVLVLNQLIPFVLSYQEKIIGGDSIDAYSEKLNNPALIAPDNEYTHINNIKQNQTKPTCPRCGKPMVIRTANRGSHTGRKFWGCSGFPVCKTTKSI